MIEQDRFSVQGRDANGYPNPPIATTFTHSVKLLGGGFLRSRYRKPSPIYVYRLPATPRLDRNTVTRHVLLVFLSSGASNTIPNND
jgi:hypothetical protein